MAGRQNHYSKGITDMQELPIDTDLEKCGVTRFTKDGDIVFIVCKGKSVIFRIQNGGLFDTLDDSEKNSAKGDKIDKPTLQAIILTLSQGEYPGIIQNCGKADDVAEATNTVETNQSKAEGEPCSSFINQSDSGDDDLIVLVQYSRI